MNTYHREQTIPGQKIENVFEFFSSEKNLELITPPWLNFNVLGKSTPTITSGTEIYYQLKLHGFSIRWTTLIDQWNPPNGFVDQQI